MLITVRPDSPEPLYSQLVAAVRGGITCGDIEPGERLPSARDLAASLGVNMHTVLRAYNELRDDGVIELRRGRGAVVRGTPSRNLELEDAVRRVIEIGRRNGLTIKQLQNELERMDGRMK